MDEPKSMIGRFNGRCVRVLSLQQEPQNEVDVLKPILEEREVLRLSWVLGALTNVNAKDLEHDALDVREFDDEFAHFLRSDVFGDSSKADGGPEVHVVGLFGKQAQVKTHLQTIGGWDEEMEVALQPFDIGMYAVVVPPGDDGVKTVVRFPWLFDELLHADQLRATPTYMLRLLTCLTMEVTCCLSVEDKTLMEDLVLADEAARGKDEAWTPYSVSFHVEQQQDVQDDIRSAVTQTVPFPHMPNSARSIDVVKGSFPALVATIGASSIKRLRPSRKWFDNEREMADWIVEKSARSELEFSAGIRWTDAVRERILKSCDSWPTETIREIFAVCVHFADVKCKMAPWPAEKNFSKRGMCNVSSYDLLPTIYSV